MICIPRIAKSFSYAVAYRKVRNVQESFVGVNINPLEPFAFLMPSFRYWYADPLLLVRKRDSEQSETVVYMEVFDRLTRRGYIGKSRFSSSGKLKRPKIVIKESFHMSFPMTFYHGGKLYMIPETSSSGEFRVYKEVGEDRWELYYHVEGHNDLVDSCLIPIYSDDCGDDLFILVGEKNTDNKRQIRPVLYKLVSFSSPERVRLDRIGTVRDYSYVERNGGRLIKNCNDVFRVRQYSDNNTYGIKLQIDRINNISASGFDNQLYREIAFHDLPLDSEASRRLRKREIIGIHTYDTTVTLNTDGMQDYRYEVVDVAWKGYSLGDVFFLYINSLCVFIKKRIDKLMER